MTDNVYEGVFEEREVELIQQWAKRAGVLQDEIPDALQEVAVVVLQQPDGWPPNTGTKRRQMLWVITRNTLGKIKRAEERRRKRDERKASIVEEAYVDDETPMRLDVQEVVSGLDERSQTVCELLSQGFSKSRIAERMNCSWNTVARLVHAIGERFEEAEVDAWLQ